MLEFLFKSKPKLRRKRRRVWVPVGDVIRLVVNGKEYLVKEILGVGENEIVVRDVDGSVKVLRKTDDSLQTLISQIQHAYQQKKEKEKDRKSMLWM